MKNTIHKVLAAILFLVIAAAPRQAQSRVTVLAALDETSTSSAVAAASTSQVETSVADTANAPVAGNESPNGSGTAATKSRGSEKTSGDSPKVRIDHPGIHVGGQNPVDIDVPSFKHRHGEMPLDVVGLVGVVFGCAVPIAIVAIVFYFRHRRLKMHHETIRAMIDKGMPIPPEMAAGTRGDLALGNTGARPWRRDFRGGLILIAVGAGLLMIAGKVGWILVFIGAARLVIWLVDDRNPKT